MTENRKKGAGTVVPLMVGGLIVAAIGFYMALNGQPPQPDTDSKSNVATSASGIHALPQDLDTTTPTVTLALKPVPSTLKLKLSQSSARASDGKPHVLETQIAMSIADVPQEDAQTLVFNRSYGDVTVTVIENGKPVLGDVPGQVAALLQTATHSLALDSTGEVKGFQLTSSPSAQMKQMMSILQDASLMMVPRFPREPVNIGEAWMFSAPYRVGGDSAGMGISGEYSMSNTYRGTVKRDGRLLAVIEQDISGQGTGAWFQKDGSKAPIMANGAGKGVFYFDIERGAVVQIDLQFEQVTTGGAGVGLQTTTRVELSPAPAS